MSPRTKRAGTEAAGLQARTSGFSPPLRTTAASGPAARAGAHAPLLVRCPECGATEGVGGVGSRTGQQVRLAATHFADERGYPYCSSCFAVWNGLPVARPMEERVEVAPPVEPYTRLGTKPSSTSRRGPKLGYRLYQLERDVNASFRLAAKGHEALRRTGDRLRDAEVVTTQLDLPPAITEAVLYHIAVLAQRTTLRSLAYNVSGEAFTLATVRVVCERFRYTARAGEDDLLATLRFADGTTVPREEYEKAVELLRTWYAANLWRDSPSTPENPKEN